MATGTTNNSSGSKGKKLHPQKLQNYTKTANRIPHQHKKRFLDGQGEHAAAVAAGAASDDDELSSYSQLPSGYVKIDDKVRISLNRGSKSVIIELKRKLVGELDQVRVLMKKLEDKETQFYSTDSNRIAGTLARANSELSYVGPTNSRSMQGGLVDYTTDTKKTPKVSSSTKKEKVLNLEKESKKVVKPSTGVKQGNVMGRYNYGEVFKKCGDLLEMLMKHNYGWIFNKPVDVKKLNLHDYYKIIKHPMDLGTVKSRLKKNWYKSPKEFAEDVRLTFNNAMRYNEKGQDAHIMGGVLLKLFEEKWAIIEAELNNVERFDMGNVASLPTPPSRRASAPPAPPLATMSAPPLQKTPSEDRILAREDAITNPADLSMNAEAIASHEGRTSMLKKPKEMDPQRREMTFEEKQRLSRDLLSLPSDNLDGVVHIIRKKNPGILQQGDEIEVDIDSFDSETLWELDRLVNNYKNGISKDNKIAEPVLQTGEVGHNIYENNMPSTAAEAPEESEAVEKFVVTSPAQIERQGDNVSRSSSSNSSSSDSGSSSSGSGSDSQSSSGYGSDAGQ
ncbi:transcription factor GTE4-like isoform X2 [Mercurialis annua]|uniref:transcription factor GTE4-like isoform X2 n=1 Tax=Mercurialis annua TaxID=3986 RepID=UPI00215FE0F3|nr:transcription factor GTE4-like isoform X2 [Mercurialis annua]